MKKNLFALSFTLTLTLASFAQSRLEKLKLNLPPPNKLERLGIAWPSEYNWKVGSNQEDNTFQMVELVPRNETVENWTIIGTMISLKGVKGVPMESVMNTTFAQTQKTSINAKLSLIEKDDNATNPWAIFKIESPGYTNDKTPESQLYYVIQGNTSLYTNFVALKEKTLSTEFLDKWIKIFKMTKLVYQ